MLGTRKVARALRPYAQADCNYFLVLGRRVHIRLRRRGADDCSLNRAADEHGRTIPLANILSLQTTEMERPHRNVKIKLSV